MYIKNDLPFSIRTLLKISRDIFFLIFVAAILLFAKTALAWEEVTDPADPGFGTTGNVKIMPGPVHNGNLIVTTENSFGGWLLYSSDGLNFTTVTVDSFDLASLGYNRLWALPVTFGNALYLSATQPGNVARIFKSNSGVDGSFEEVVTETLESASTDESITSAALANDYIYVGTFNNNPLTGGSVHRFYSDDKWEAVLQSATHLFDGNHRSLYLSGPIDGYIYGGTVNSINQAQLWRYNISNGEWGPIEQVSPDTLEIICPAPVRFNGHIYLVAKPHHVGGVQVWRSITGESDTWNKVLGPSEIGDESTIFSEGSISIPGNGYLYISFHNASTGTQIWRTDGNSWEKINEDGFGDSHNWNSFLSPVLFNGYLYAGTENIYGARLYRIYAPSSSSDRRRGEMVVVGSSGSGREGTINPDKGEEAKIIFRGSREGKYTLVIYTILGEEVYRQSRNSSARGEFNWAPGNLSSGVYLAHISGPGLDERRKIAILR